MGNGRIFLSYAREDLETAKRLYSDLTARGLDVWWDVESLQVGQNWALAIRQAIRDSRFFIALMSSRSVGKAGYIQKETRLGLEALEELPPDRVFVLPVRVDDCEPSHPRLNDLHRLDLFPSYRQSLERLVGVLSEAEPERPRDAGPTTSAERVGFLETFDPLPGRKPADMFNGCLLFGHDDVWEGAAVEGCYRLRNRAGPDHVRYYYVDIRETQDGRRQDSADAKVSVDTAVAFFPKSAPYSGAGLLYRFDENAGTYYMFVLQHSGQFEFRKRTQGGMTSIYAGRAAMDTDGFNKLSIQGDGPTIRLWINDDLAATLYDDALPAGSPGIVAVGVGEYRFDNFMLFENPI